MEFAEMGNRLSLFHSVREPLEPSVEPPPVLVMLHGVGSNEEDLMGLAPMLDPRFFVISARAPITLQHGSYAWYHLEFTQTGQIINHEEAESSRLRLLQFVEEIAESYDVNPDRLYLMGFSQGCIMSLSAALTQPRRFAGIVGMSGRLLPDVVPKLAPASELNQLPVLIVHGTDDRVISIEYGRAIREALEKLPVDVTYREYNMGHTISNQSLAYIERWLTERLDSNTDWRSLNP
jgi:phospholipase/carboxylesterase